MSNSLYDESVVYHREPTAGKIKIVPTKPLASQQDLALAYSPGVAGPCLAIQENPALAADLTARGNLIAVISNGTAVLGLGNIGALASKPVMEGKAVLFQKFANIDAIDIEINETDPDKLIDIIASLEPSFGGINLEDIRAPECFYIEKKLSERLNIPVFHDDQHGTAIIVAAAILNGLSLVNKKISRAKIVVSGAGAAALACLDLLLDLGLTKENIIILDSKGVVHEGRVDKMDGSKARFATQHPARSLAEAMVGADVFLGLSAGGVVSKEMVASMAASPLILALANPEPEIRPELVKEVRSDAIIATGRSDYPNQVNNVLCFPYIFRGALDVGATTINKEMKLACVKALSKLAQSEVSDVVSQAYGGNVYCYGPDYIIPKPFDLRLSVELPIVVAEAAMMSGVAARPIHDMAAYREKLMDMTYRSSMIMRPVFALARQNKMRISFAEGEDERVLRAAQIIVDENLCHPILIGRPNVIAKRIEKLGLRIKPEVDFELIDPNNDSRYHQYWKAYHQLMEREGVSPDAAKFAVRSNPTIIAALTVHIGDADSMIVGTSRLYHEHLKDVLSILRVSPTHNLPAALGVLLLDGEVCFVADPYVNMDPTAEEIYEITAMAVEQVRHFGLKPKVALLSHSNFGSSSHPAALKMRKALALIKDKMPDLEVEGEMHADAALSPLVRESIFPNSQLTGEANILIMPNMDAANIAFNLTKILSNGLPIGPILMGTHKPGHIVSPSITVRGLLNMTAIASVDAHERLRNNK